MNIVLCGHSAVGKDQLQKLLTENFRYERAVPTTTRPKRSNEEEGVDYYFVNDDVFEQIDRQKMFATTSCFNGWNYGIELTELNKKNWVVVANDVQFQDLLYQRDVMGKIDFMSILITADEDERIKRQIIRGDDTDEIAKRLVRDGDKWEELEYLFDYIVPNNDDEWDAIVEILTCVAEHSKTSKDK